MVEKVKKPKKITSLADSAIKKAIIRSSLDQFNSSWHEDEDRIAELDMLKEVKWVGENYQPLDDSRLRLIAIERRVTGDLRGIQSILDSLAALRQKISDLQTQVTQLTESVGEASKYSSMIYDLGDGLYELSMPIQIVLEEDQEETVARIPELNLYASGDTDAEAIVELKKEVVKLLEDLESSDRPLGRLPKSWLNTLKKLVVKRSG